MSATNSCSTAWRRRRHCSAFACRERHAGPLAGRGRPGGVRRGPPRCPPLPRPYAGQRVLHQRADAVLPGRRRAVPGFDRPHRPAGRRLRHPDALDRAQAADARRLHDLHQRPRPDEHDRRREAAQSLSATDKPRNARPDRKKPMPLCSLLVHLDSGERSKRPPETRRRPRPRARRETHRPVRCGPRQKPRPPTPAAPNFSPRRPGSTPNGSISTGGDEERNPPPRDPDSPAIST